VEAASACFPQACFLRRNRVCWKPQDLCAVLVAHPSRYHAWPYRLLDLQDRDPNKRNEILESFFSAPACCLDTWVSEPLRSRTTCPADLKSPQIASLLRELSHRLAKTTNMQLENLLSEVKASVPKGKQTAYGEKTAYLSHLSQLMKQHLQRGRRDLRGCQRQDELLEMGVPLARRSRSGVFRHDMRWKT
jgi:hypothetical protein